MPRSWLRPRTRRWPNALLRPEDSEVLRTREGQSFQLESFVYKLEHTPHGYQFSVSQGKDAAYATHHVGFWRRKNQPGLRNRSIRARTTKATSVTSEASPDFDRTTNQPAPCRVDPGGGGTHRDAGGDPAVLCLSCSGGHGRRGLQRSDSRRDVRSVSRAGRGPRRRHEGPHRRRRGIHHESARLDRTASVDFCGSCHMTWVDVQLERLDGSVNRPLPRLPAGEQPMLGQGRCAHRVRGLPRSAPAAWCAPRRTTTRNAWAVT